MVGNTPGSISFATLGAVDGARGVAMVDVEGAAPSETGYPWRQEFFVVYREGCGPVARAFLKQLPQSGP
ncbi:MAG: hypothetical protein ACLFOY_15655 [Desulfatibacillaceae bacterium]